MGKKISIALAAAVAVATITGATALADKKDKQKEEATTYNIQIVAENGTVTANPAKAAHKEPVTLNIEADQDYTCNEIKIIASNKQEVKGATCEKPQFTMPNKDVTVTVSFTYNEPGDIPTEPTEEPTEDEPTEEVEEEITEEEAEPFVAPDTGVSSAAILFGTAATLTLGGVLVSLKAKQA